MADHSMLCYRVRFVAGVSLRGSRPGTSAEQRQDVDIRLRENEPLIVVYDSRFIVKESRRSTDTSVGVLAAHTQR